MTTTTDYDLQGRVCMVTGATSGIGRETALSLARFGAAVLLVARDRTRGEQTAEQIRSQAPHAAVEVLVADLASQHDVRDLAAQVRAGQLRLDVLVHNAAVVHGARRLSPDGIEATLAVNHLAPFLLTHLLAPLLLATPDSRVVTVSSYMHRRVKHIPWDDLQFEDIYSAQDVYNLTKLMNILFTYELARRWAGTSHTANALHPGWPIKTNLGRDQRGAGGTFDRASKLFGVSAATGARTTVHLSSAPELAGVTGGYFVRSRPAKSSTLSYEQHAARRLWTRSAELCAVSSSLSADDSSR